jgi:hypothetical protein
MMTSHSVRLTLVACTAAVLGLVVFAPTVAQAQAPTLVGSSPPLKFGGAPPEVTAAGAEWQVNGEPIVVEGLQYQATREFRPFDTNVMTQISLYQRVPIYADTTLEPFTVVYVPIGSSTMRAYTHASDALLAATSPIPAESPKVTAPPPVSVGTTRTALPPAAPPKTPARRRTTSAATLHSPGRTLIWIAFAGARYDSDGEAAVFSADRFTKIGEYRGFPVYRAVNDVKKDRIWVTQVKDGPVAPFVKR